jgi:hypothetical protein
VALTDQLLWLINLFPEERPMTEPDRSLYFAYFSGLHSQHATNHTLLHAQPGDSVGSVMITFPLGVAYIPLLLTPDQMLYPSVWKRIESFPQPDHIRNQTVRMNEVTSANPFEVETDGLIVDIAQWFPPIDSDTGGAE